MLNCSIVLGARKSIFIRRGVFQKVLGSMTVFGMKNRQEPPLVSLKVSVRPIVRPLLKVLRGMLVRSHLAILIWDTWISGSPSVARRCSMPNNATIKTTHITKPRSGAAVKRSAPLKIVNFVGQCLQFFF